MLSTLIVKVWGQLQSKLVFWLFFFFDLYFFVSEMFVWKRDKLTLNVQRNLTK